MARWQIFPVTGKEHSKEKQHRALLGPVQSWLLFSMIFSLFDILIFKKPRRICETGCTGQVEAKKAVSLATAAIWKAGKPSLSHFSFHFLRFLKGGQMLCVKFTLQFCLWYLLSQSWGRRITVQVTDCFFLFQLETSTSRQSYLTVSSQGITEYSFYLWAPQNRKCKSLSPTHICRSLVFNESYSDFEVISE